MQYQYVQIYGSHSSHFQAASGYALWMGQTPGSSWNHPFNAHSHVDTDRMVELGMQYCWATDGKLKHIYYAIDDQNISAAGNTLTWVVYRYRPDGSTNTGPLLVYHDTVGNMFAGYTEIDEQTVSNADLQDKRRGNYVAFDSSASFAAGDFMAIKFKTSADTGAGSQPVSMLAGYMLLEQDYNNIVTGNI